MTSRRALVVGGSGAIGGAIADVLAELGMHVSLWGRDVDRLARQAARCRERAGSASHRVVDAGSVDAVTGAVRRECDDEGAWDVVVWCAGGFDWAPAQHSSADAWDEVLRSNLNGAAALTSAALPHLVRRAPSTLVFIGSLAGHRTFAHNAAYVAAKHGLVALAAATFADVRDLGVKVSVVSPGMVSAGASLATETARTRPDDLIAPADVADAVRFVVTSPTRTCPTQVVLEPQRTP